MHEVRISGSDRPMTQLLLFNIFNGLIVGAFYALMALGLSLILNLSGVINFAHGGFLALGAYIAYTLIPYVGFWGGLAIAPFATAAVGIVVERVLIRRVYGRDPLYSLLLTFGLAYIFEDALRAIWGAQSVPYSIPPLILTRGARRVVFTPDARSIVVLRGDVGHKNFWRVDLGSGAQRQLTELAPEVVIRDFDLSRDGGAVLYDRVEESSRIALIERGS
jgi:hypothetical protein